VVFPQVRGHVLTVDGTTDTPPGPAPPWGRPAGVPP
jgi:hypothetical protein